MDQYNFLLQSVVKLGHHIFVEKLLKKNDFPVSVYPLILAITKKDTDMVVILLSDKRFDNVYDEALEYAIEVDAVYIVYRILKIIKRPLDIKHFYAAVKKGNVAIIELFISEIDEEYFFQAANIASSQGNEEVLDYFSNYFTIETANYAKTGRILEKIGICPDTIKIQEAIISNDFNMINALLLYYSPSDIVSFASSNGKINIIKYIKNRFQVIPTRDDCLSAYTNGYVKISRQIYNIMYKDLSQLRLLIED